MQEKYTQRNAEVFSVFSAKDSFFLCVKKINHDQKEQTT